MSAKKQHTNTGLRSISVALIIGLISFSTQAQPQVAPQPEPKTEPQTETQQTAAKSAEQPPEQSPEQSAVKAEKKPDIDRYAYVEPQPHWSLDIKKGSIEPNNQDWDNYYKEKYSTQYAIGFGYKFSQQLEVGAELGYIKDKGLGVQPLGGGYAPIRFEQFPVNLYLLLRGKFAEGQFIVPYVGGGYTRSYYRQSTDNQASVRTDYSGSHTRYGIQILLDSIDSGGAAAMQTDHWVENTYFTVEVQKYKIETSEGADLGGQSILYGLMVEF